MSSVDDKIVELEFKATDFVSGVSSVLAAITKLKSGLNLDGATKSLTNLDDAGKKFSLANIASSVEGMASKFSTLGTVGVAALATIASKAVTAGLQLVKAFTIDPIKAGLDVYETKINAIQTILANTQSEGTNLSQVTAALDQLNTYANKTVYNFGEMAKNIGTFTAAGVGLKDSVASIKGIANLAALSGSSAEQASTAMYQLSQAIANGKVNLQDWNSVVNAGIGGKVFQTALENTARATGVNIDAIIKKAGSFRNSLQEGWLSSKILTQTLSTFTGDLTDQQLKSMGYSEQQIKQIQATAAAAVQSATQIRTVTQLHQALAEEVATAWSHVWEAVIGNSTDAAKTLTSLHNVLENALTGPINGLANFLSEFDKLGGRNLVILTIVQAFKTLQSILKPIADAFRDVFPPVTVNQILILVSNIHNLLLSMQLGTTAAGNLRKTFDGLFSIIKIGIDVVIDVAKGIASMFSGAGKAGDGLLSLTGTIGQFITKAKDSLENGSALATFFTDLGKVIGSPIKLLGLMVGALGDLGSEAKKVYGVLQPFLSEVAGAFGQLGAAIAQSISSGSFANVEHALNQGLFALILVQIKKFIKSFTDETEGGGFLDEIKEKITGVFDGLTGSLKAMQNSIKSGTLLKIAAAVALLTASVVALSFINAGKLTTALTAITLMFTELLAGMAIISKIAGIGGIVQITVISAALNLLATAILILAGAVAILSQFSWTELAKGLGSIVVLLTALVGAVKLMSGDSVGLVSAAAAMVLIAAALNLLALAVKQLGALDFGSLLKGVGAITALLIVIGAFQKFGGGEDMIASAAAMLLLGAALNVIAQAMITFGSMSWSEIATGLVAMAGSLAILVTAMTLMPPDMLVTAASLLIVAGAMVILAQALGTMGNMSWSEIAKSLVELAASLTILAIAMALMVEGLPGAAALLVMAAALTLLVPVLIALGNLTWAQILTSLAALAGVFLVLGVAGLLLGPIVPILVALGLAITLMGVGILAAGAGTLAFAAGLTALGIAVTASGVAITSFVRSLLALVPYAISQLGQGLIQLANLIGNDAPQIATAFGKLVTALLNVIITVTPKIAQAIQTILTQVLNLVNKNAAPVATAMTNLMLKVLQAIAAKASAFATAGTNIVVNVLNGIAKNVSRMATAGGNIVVAFINAVGAQAARIATAGVNMVINLVNNVANSIRSHESAMNAAGRNLAEAIISGMIAGISGGLAGVENEAVNIAKSALSAAKSALGINSPSKEFQYIGEGTGEGMVIGIHNSIQPVEKASAQLGNSAIDAMKNSLGTVSDVINDNLQLQPTITPVIDLTQAQKGFNDLNSMTKSQLLSANVTTNKAQSISSDNLAAATEAGLTAAAGATVSFVQNNTSPKALNTADIYRQTNNQLSKVKGALPR